MLLSRDPVFKLFSVYWFVVLIHKGFSALAGAGVFLLRKKKGTKEIRPKQPAPEKRWGKPQLPTLPTRLSDSQSRSQTSIRRPWRIAATKVEICGRLYRVKKSKSKNKSKN